MDLSYATIPVFGGEFKRLYQETRILLVTIKIMLITQSMKLNKILVPLFFIYQLIKKYLSLSCQKKK